jgi:heme oxygenase (mycobilin-producing)
MTNPETNTSGITVANIFDIEPGMLEPCIALWRDRAAFVRQQPGFRSLRLLRAISADARFSLVSLVEWESADSLRLAADQEHYYEGSFRAAEELEVSGHPAVYRVVMDVNAP